MDNKDKIIEEMANIISDCTWVTDEDYCESISCEECHAKRLYEHGYRKLPEDSVVLSREEYDELINLQRTHAEDFTNAMQSYEESKTDLKLEYSNHIKSLEKTIDRQSKDLNSQADRLIDLKAKIEQERKETAEKIYYKAEKKAYFKDGGYYDKDRYYLDMEDLKEILKQFGVEIKE